MLGPLLKDVCATDSIEAEILLEGTSCSTGMFKKYGRGAKQPEKLLGDALWQRTGKSMEKFQVFLEQDEYWLGSGRAEIQSSLRKGDIAGAEEALCAYEKTEGTDRPQHRQFICLQRAELYRREEKPHEEQMSIVREGLAYTIHCPLLPEILKTHRFGMLELLLLERYAFLLEQEMMEEAVRWYVELEVYLTLTQEEGMEIDHADQYRLLPPVLYHHAVWAVKVGFFKQALEMLTDGLRMLSERHAFLALFIRMEELKLEILPELGMEVPAWEAECLRLLKEMVQKCNPAWMENIYPDYPELSLYCVNDALRERRLAWGKTIKDIAGEFDTRTIKAVESGKRMPQTATKNALFQEFRLSTYKYGGSMLTRRYSDFRECAKMMKHDYRKEYEQAEQIYKKLIKGLKKEEVINAQFTNYWDIRLRYGKNQIGREQYRRELWELLERTLPKHKEIKVDCVLTEYERDILETLAWTVNLKDEDIVYVEEILDTQYRKFQDDGALVCFFPEYYATLAYCLGRIARLRRDYEKAENILDDMLGQLYFLQNDFRLESLFIQRFQLHNDIREAQGLSPAQDGDEFFQDIRYAYAINKLYLRDIVGMDYIEKFIEKNFKNKNAICDLF